MTKKKHWWEKYPNECPDAEEKCPICRKRLKRDPIGGFYLFCPYCGWSGW